MGRKLGKKQKVPMTGNQIEKLKRDSTARAFKIMRMLPMLALRDEYGFGKVRMERYNSRLDEIVEAYNDGYLELEDVGKTLKKEIGYDVWKTD